MDLNSHVWNSTRAFKPSTRAFDLVTFELFVICNSQLVTRNSQLVFYHITFDRPYRNPITNDKSLKSLWKQCAMVVMQNHTTTFYLLKFVDLKSNSHHNNSGVCFFPIPAAFSFIFLVQNIGSFWSNAVVNFSLKLNKKVCMHGSNNDFLVL